MTSVPEHTTKQREAPVACFFNARFLSLAFREGSPLSKLVDW